MPLAGRRILCTRGTLQSAELQASLEALGAQTLAIATIQIEPPVDREALAASVAAIPEQDWVVFTSANGVRAVPRQALAGARIAVVGPATAAALTRVGLRASLMPERHTAADLADALCRESTVAGCRILLLRSQIAGSALPDALRAAGAQVCDIVAYRTLRAAEGATLQRALRSGIELVIFTSGSTARAYVELAGADWLRDLAPQPSYASIGPVTTAAAREAGLTIALEARTHTIDGLVEAIRTFAFTRGEC